MSMHTDWTTEVNNTEIDILLGHAAPLYHNLSVASLVEHAIRNGEALLASNGALVAATGQYTGRSPKDKFIVRRPEYDSAIDWGAVNQPMAPEVFERLLLRVTAYLANRPLYVQDCYAGADPRYRLKVRVINEMAWHNLFAKQLFIRPPREELADFRPNFLVLHAPNFKTDPAIDGTRSEVVVALDFVRRIVLIAGTAYAGEIKKSIFTVLNFILPLQGVFPMHCSANVGARGDVALFFGLSGTGKTTLSADPHRRLIGDDEHGWSDEGVFNFEGGCYAKVIRLSPEAEPQIYAATQRFGTILENVVYDPTSRSVDLNDDTITENTRASYPLDFIPNVVPEKMTRTHPENVIFLTCDASGVLPPIARLSPQQAMYHFISGYTSKIAGTEVGLGIEPQITFSACFGAPFMVHHPYRYADLLRQKLARYGCSCWLVNTGWTGGSFGVGKRISIRHTRALLSAVLDGRLKDARFRPDRLFGFDVPTSCPDVPVEILDPANSWANRDEYWKRYDALAARFTENFKLFAAGVTDEVLQAGPKRLSQL